MIINSNIGGSQLDSTTAAASDILSGKTAYNGNGTLMSGTMTNNGAVSKSLSINGSYTIPAGYHNGSGKVTQSISTKGATTYNTSTSNQTISSGYYLSGTQTIRGVTTSNIDAANIKKGVNILVGDSASSGRIKNVTGTYTSDATAAAANIMNGYTAYANGNLITGSGFSTTTTANAATILSGYTAYDNLGSLITGTGSSGPSHVSLESSGTVGSWGEGSYSFKDTSTKWHVGGVVGIYDGSSYPNYYGPFAVYVVGPSGSNIIYYQVFEGNRGGTDFTISATRWSMEVDTSTSHGSIYPYHVCYAIW